MVSLYIDHSKPQHFPQVCSSESYDKHFPIVQFISKGMVMRLKQVKGEGILSVRARRYIEGSFFHDLDGAVRGVQRCFPHHVVSKRDGRVCVSNKDGSMNVAVFQGVSQTPSFFQNSPRPSSL